MELGIKNLTSSIQIDPLEKKEENYKHSLLT
jgi:hypothetical protein